MLTKSSKYAIRALVFIQIQNWNKQRPGALEIAREIDAPIAFLAKILQTLVKKELLVSQKGRGGGFFFAENESGLSLYDVIHAMEGDACFYKCGFDLKNCNKENPCSLHDKYVVVREEFYKITRDETIHTVARKIMEGDAVLNN